MIEKYLELLKDEGRRWEVALELLDYTRTCLSVRHGWREGKMLPGGVDPEGIVVGLIEKVVSEDPSRRLNACMGLLIQLKGMIRSEVSNLFKSSDAKQDVFEIAGDDGPKHEPVRGPAADEIVGSHDFCHRIFELLEEHPKVQADPNFGCVILAYEEGAATAGEVASKTGMNVERIYEYNRQLKKIYPSIKAKLNDERAL